MSAKWAFVLGVQKSGTTTVADILSAQPEVFVPSIKETYFFCDEKIFPNGESWFLKEFYSSSKAQSASIVCDATPFYFASPESIERILAFSDESTRFILCLRDPVKRAYSAYWHQCRLGNESLSFEDALIAESDRVATAKSRGERWWRHAYYEIGLYGKHLSYLFSRIDKEKCFIIFESDLSDQEKLTSRLRQFLGLSDLRVSPTVLSPSNTASMPRFRFVQRFIIGDHFIKRLLKKLIPREQRTRIAKSILKLNGSKSSYEAMSPKTFAMLRARYAGDLDVLAALGVRVPDAWKSQQHLDQ